MYKNKLGYKEFHENGIIISAGYITVHRFMCAHIKPQTHFGLQIRQKGETCYVTIFQDSSYCC